MKLEVCILAGGLSTRMGRDKARLRFGRRTMLSIIRDTAGALEFPVRIIRRDAVPRCGPLGGVFTAMKTTRADAVLFLACDMPLVSPALLRRLIHASRSGQTAVFAARGGRIGFPFLLPRSALAAIQSRIKHRAFSVQPLAALLNGRIVAVPVGRRELMNVNTPADATLAGRLLSQTQTGLRARRASSHSGRQQISPGRVG